MSKYDIVDMKPGSTRRDICVLCRRDVDPIEWIIEWPLGEITLALSPEDALAQIQKWAEQLCKRLKKNIVTVVNWYNAAPDFTPPSRRVEARK